MLKKFLVFTTVFVVLTAYECYHVTDEMPFLEHSDKTCVPGNGDGCVLVTNFGVGVATCGSPKLCWPNLTEHTQKLFLPRLNQKIQHSKPGFTVLDATVTCCESQLCNGSACEINEEGVCMTIRAKHYLTVACGFREMCSPNSTIVRNRILKFFRVLGTLEGVTIQDEDLTIECCTTDLCNVGNGNNGGNNHSQILSTVLPFTLVSLHLVYSSRLRPRSTVLENQLHQFGKSETEGTQGSKVDNSTFHQFIDLSILYKNQHFETDLSQILRLQA